MLGGAMYTTIKTLWEKTKNKSEIIGDSILSGAILDRIVHHSEVIKITGASYRRKKLKKGVVENIK